MLPDLYIKILFKSMFNIFISSLVGSVIIISNAYIFNFLFFKKKINQFNLYKDTLLGFIFIGFVSLFLNFFFPINKIVSSIFIVFSISVFIYFFFNFKKKSELILILIFLSITTFLIITLSNINRPDAGLYHLPFIKILNENKIIIGLSNLHFRFGHTSIIQYISAINVSYFFKEEFLNIPLATLPGLYFLFLFKNYFDELKEKNEINIIAIFLIFVFSLYSFNRFSSLGNDGPANIFFFVILVTFLKIKNIESVKSNDFYLITIISLFLLMLKPMMIFVLILPLILFLLNKNKYVLIKDKKNIFCIVFLFLWVLKNILISGCSIFPLEKTCFKNLKYYNSEIVKHASVEAEAWAKGYPDSNIKNGYEEYNKNFNWLETWLKNHFNKVLEKILPLVILIIILIIIYNFQHKNLKILRKHKILVDKKFLYLVFFLSFYVFIWFIKFPLYRFGMAFISSFIIILFVCIFINNEKQLYNKKILTIFLIFGLTIIFTKNINRIFNNFNLDYNNAPWPAIYSMDIKDKNQIKEFNEILNENNEFLYFYSNGEECMYSKSPCSNILNKDLKKYLFYGYKIYYY